MSSTLPPTTAARPRWVIAAVFVAFLFAAACGGEGDIEAHYEAGTQLHQKGLYAEAIEEYHAAIDIDPSFAYAYDRRGASYKEIGQTNRAFADYNEAIRLEPTNALFHNNRGDLYNRLARYERALEDLDQAIRLDPQLGVAYGNRGYTYLQLGQLGLALNPNPPKG